MHAYTTSYWDEQWGLAKLPLHERLRREADAEDRIAEQFRNCTWMGDEHPSARHRRRASELREAAWRLQAAEEVPRRRREARKAREAQQRTELLDSMVEDRDY